MTLSAIELSVCNGVGGCLCPISTRIILMYTASRVMMYSAPNSASVADDMTCFIMCAILSMAPLLGGLSVSCDRKNWPPARLRAFGSLK